MSLYNFYGLVNAWFGLCCVVSTVGDIIYGWGFDGGFEPKVLFLLAASDSITEAYYLFIIRDKVTGRMKKYIYENVLTNGIIA